MSVFNGERFLRAAIDSILNQTYSDFEFIIIDDGSSDRSLEIIRQYQKLDKRIVIIQNESNIGLAGSLNNGIAVAKGEFIARMDADDVSLPARLGKQFSFMKKNPEVGVVGSQIQIIDSHGNVIENDRLPTSDTLIRWKMCFENPIRHPTVMMRTSLVRQVNGYRDYKTTQDYDLWQRISEISELRNLDETLILYRLHDSNISLLSSEIRIEVRHSTKQRAINNIIGKKVKINWKLYWNNPYYSAKIVIELYKALLNELSTCERRKIKKDTGALIYKKARALSKDKSLQKIVLFLVSFIFFPKLVFRFLGEICFKNKFKYST